MNRTIITLVLALLVTPQAKPPDASKVSAELQARLLKLQLQAARIQSNAQACVAADFQGQFTKVNVDEQQVINEAFAQAKLDKKDWELNLDSFEFVKKAAPAKDDKK
jgi:type II secretory pathway component PulM